MILLDTNVISELRKKAGNRVDPAVLRWEQSVATQLFLLSAVTIQEIDTGILLADRHDAQTALVLRQWLEREVLGTFAGRILPYDTEVARACAALHVRRTRRQRDAMIAATALVHDLTLATRNTRDFEGTGVRLVNPWTYRVGTGSSPVQS